jgi:hypothetical protein
MRIPGSPRRSAFLAGVLLVGLASTITSARLSDFPPSKCGPAVKDIIPLLDAKKLDMFGAKDTTAGKFVAVSYVPSEGMFGVSAGYTRPGDIEYFINHQDYKSVYESLRSSTYATDRIIIDDAEANGLVPQPKRSQPDDDAVFGMDRKTFDGIFSEPKKTDPKKPSFDDYLKNFTQADDAYTHILTVVTDALKKGAS